MKFILFLIVVVAAIYLVRSYKKTSVPKGNKELQRFDENISLLIEEAIELSNQDVAMPFQIFELAGKLAPHPNKDDVIAAVDYIYNMDTAKFGFARRVSLTTLRFIGPYHYSVAAQNTVDYLILRGLEDEAVWVRYDAAWVSTVLKIQNTDIISRLQILQSNLKDKDIPAKSPEEKLRDQVNEFFEI